MLTSKWGAVGIDEYCRSCDWFDNTIKPNCLSCLGSHISTAKRFPSVQCGCPIRRHLNFPWRRTSWEFPLDVSCAVYTLLGFKSQIRVTCILGVISDFRHDVDYICALLGCYAALSRNSVPTFQDNVSVPSSRVKKFKKNIWASWPSEMGQIGCPETSVHNYHSTLRDIPEEHKCFMF
jgi:hypothetical protein